jgi:hypothetical protein
MRGAIIPLENTIPGGSLCPVNWIETIHQWQSLPAAEKLRRRWQAIPQDVAQSMAFEQEPVELRHLQELLDRIEPPASSKPLAASLPIPS